MQTGVAVEKELSEIGSWCEYRSGEEFFARLEN
jgi:hypothetical protein